MSVSDTCSKVFTWVFIRISMGLHVLSASTSADVTNIMVFRAACHLRRRGSVSDTCSKVCTLVFIRISMVFHVLSASKSADVTHIMISWEACQMSVSDTCKVCTWVFI